MAPSFLVLSLRYFPDPSTLTRPALTLSESSPDISNRSLTSLLLLTFLYLNVYRLTFVVLVGMFEGKMSIPAVEFLASYVRPMRRAWQVYEGISIFLSFLLKKVAVLLTTDTLCPSWTNYRLEFIQKDGLRMIRL